MKVVLKSITPIHIGNGEELHALDYVINSQTKTYYRISQKLFFDFIKSYPELINKYTIWINDFNEKMGNIESEIAENKKKAGRIKDEIKKLNKQQHRQLINEKFNFISKIKDENEDYNQKLSRLKREFNLLNFAKSEKIENHFLKFLDTNAQDKIELGSIPKQQSIRGHLKTGTNILYIPGSSIKGAIRTALLYKVLSKEKNKVSIERYLQSEADKPKPNKKYVGEKIEKQYGFGCGFEKFDKSFDYSNAQFDLLKLLTVSDAKILNPGKSISVLDTNLYLVKKDKNGSLEAKKQDGSPSLEVIKSGCQIAFDIDFNIEFLLSVKNQISENSITNNGKKQWIGIESKVEDAFKLKIKDLTYENKEEKKNEVLKYLLTAVTEFSHKQIEVDYTWYENFNEFDDNSILNSYVQIPDNLNLIRIGFGSGFSGTTEMLYLVKNHLESYEAILKKIDRKFKGLKDFPKSRLLAANNSEISPIGWLEIVEPKIANAQHSQTTQSKIIKDEPIEKLTFDKINLTTIIPAIVLKIQRPHSLVKLEILDKEIIVLMTGIKATELKDGFKLFVQVTSMKDKEIKMVKFIKF